MFCSYLPIYLALFLDIDICVDKFTFFVMKCDSFHSPIELIKAISGMGIDNRELSSNTHSAGLLISLLKRPSNEMRWAFF